MKQNTTKLKNNNAMATSADKGNSIVILPIQQYKQKIRNFINNDNFQTTNTNPMKTFQGQIRKTINNSTTLIGLDSRWKYKNLNPTEPTIRGLIKLHKTDQPIQPIVNWRNAPAYKLAKLLTEKIQHFAQLPYTYNIRNTAQLIQELKQTPLTTTSVFASLGIMNMYSNIPIRGTKYILNSILTQNLVDQQTPTEILNWYEIITQQNYFTNDGEIFIQKDGLAMGAPSSSIISEIFLQNIEQIHLPTIAKKHGLTNYFRFVDDILIIYDTQHTNITSILEDFNSLHPSLHFTKETEKDNKINYLDNHTHRHQENIRTSVYRNPTYTDTIIPYNSNHPPQHKYVAIRFLHNRLKTYDLQDEEFQQEVNIIQNILHNNAYRIPTQAPKNKHKTQVQTPPQTHTQSNTQSNTLSSQIQQTHTDISWCTFTYTGKETTFITKLFKHTNIRIAYRTNNYIWKHLYQNTPEPDKYRQSGVYKLTCPDCGKAYIRQTGREFHTRYNEHKRAFHYNPQQSTYAQHLTENRHSFGTINNIMEFIHLQKKGKHLNTIEKFHIYKEARHNNHLNDDHTITINKIFDTILTQLQ